MWKRPGYASIKAVVSSFYLPKEIKKKKASSLQNSENSSTN